MKDFCENKVCINGILAETRGRTQVWALRGTGAPAESMGRGHVGAGEGPSPGDMCEQRRNTCSWDLAVPTGGSSGDPRGRGSTSR